MATSRSATDAVTIHDPSPGSLVELVAGSRLCLRFRSGLGPSRWHLAAHPGNLLPLLREESELSFLVFNGAPATLRLERRHPRSDVVRQVCELRIEVVEADELASTRRRSA